MNKTIGILAHVDAGKTTFSEQLLYYTKSIKQRGRVDHQNAFLDHHEIERQRGITVFAEQAVFEFKGSTYTLIDTPGHVDFSPEMERSIAVLDAAILIVSAVEGVEAHTETVWQLLRKHAIPTFIFINKIDRSGADTQRVTEQLKRELSPDILPLTAELGQLTLSEEQIEDIAARSEILLELYMEQGYDLTRWKQALQEMIGVCELFPCFHGSALQNVGVEEFIEVFHELTITEYDAEAAMSGRVYKIRYDDVGTRYTYIKLLSGTLSVRQEISYGVAEGGTDQAAEGQIASSKQGSVKVEKITQIRRYNGSQYETVKQAFPGELVAVAGLSDARIGDGVGILQERFIYETTPTLTSSVQLQPGVNAKEILPYFRIMEAEDPSLNVIWDERQSQIQLHVMGKIQLEVLHQLLRDRYSLNVTFAPPSILYKETIASSVIGYGHFEPLRHYAEVHIEISPAPRGAGVSYSSNCHVDKLAAASQRLIGQHLLEREHRGLLTGSPLTDVHITLLNGREHNKHTHGGDFREATMRALRQGLEKAENVLLEPYYDFKITVHIDQMGRIMSDIQQAHGELEPLSTEGDRAKLRGKVPVATFLDYASELASLTGGKGRLNLGFGGYAPCHNAEVVIADIGYDKDADPEYTSSSIFCAKGAGYSVRWDEAESMMHIKD